MEQNNDKRKIAKMEEQIKGIVKESDSKEKRLEKFLDSFQKFKDNDFYHLALKVEKLKISIELNNKLTWVILASVLGLAFFVIRSIIIN